MEAKGLTGIREEARGFVGSKPPPIYDSTKNDRPRIRFNIACGQNKEEAGKYTTWRYCIGYDAVAQILKNLQIGDLVKVSGWITTECLKDDYYKPITDSDGRTKTREFLVLFRAEITEYRKQHELQPPLLAGVSS